MSPEPSRIAYILYTSGTTLRPKGVQISFGALAAHIATISRQYRYNSETKILNALPLSHTDGLIQGPVIAYFIGATLFRPCQFRQQNLTRYLDAIYTNKITHMVAVPTMLAIILRLAENLEDFFRTEDYQFTISAAAHLEEELWEKFETQSGHMVINHYGLTETVTGSLFSGPGKATRRVGSLGKPVDCEAKIVDDAGAEVPTGETGELVLGGEHLMTGYFEDARGTANVLRDRLLYTGDLGRIDGDGFYYYMGRKKNIIISGGLNISPEEVTSIIRLHPDVIDTVTFGEPQKDWGEQVVSCVALKAGSVATSKTFAELCRRHLSTYKIPKRILILPELPKGRTGKVLLEEVKKLAILNTRSANDDPTEDIPSALLKVAADCFELPMERLALQSSPANTPDWDSLGHMAFMTALEARFAMKLTTKEIISIDSLQKAFDIVEHHIAVRSR